MRLEKTRPMIKPIAAMVFLSMPKKPPRDPYGSILSAAISIEQRYRDVERAVNRAILKRASVDE